MKRINKFLKEYYKLILFSLVCIIFFVLIAFLFNKEIVSLDSSIYNYILEHFISDKLTSFIKVVTLLGGSYFLIGITVGFMFFVKNKRISFFTSFNLMLAAILGQLLKFIIRRPRPNILPLVEENGFSFPSGHSLVSMAFYGFLIYLAYKNIKSNWIKIPLIIVLISCIFLVGFSRIYLGVHYISDVLGGFMIALCYLVVYICVFKRIKF